MDISPLMPLISWAIYQYAVSVVVGTIVIEFIGAALVRTIIIRFSILGIGISLTVGAVAGFVVKSFLGL